MAAYQIQLARDVPVFFEALRDPLASHKGSGNPLSTYQRNFQSNLASEVLQGAADTPEELYMGMAGCSHWQQAQSGLVQHQVVHSTAKGL